MNETPKKEQKQLAKEEKIETMKALISAARSGMRPIEIFAVLESYRKRGLFTMRDIDVVLRALVRVGSISKEQYEFSVNNWA